VNKDLTITKIVESRMDLTASCTSILSKTENNHYLDSRSSTSRTGPSTQLGLDGRPITGGVAGIYGGSDIQSLAAS